MEKNCETCGKEFSVKKYLFDVRRHCSAECKRKANRITLICKCCGNAWETWKSQVAIKGRPGAGQFCSKDCADKSLIKPKPEKPPKKQPSEIYKVCEVCEATFRVYPCRKDTARFCSNHCKGISEVYRAKCSEQQQGEKSWRWSGGKYATHEGYVRAKSSKNGKEIFRFEHSRVMIEWITEEDPHSPFLIDIDGTKRLHPDVEVHHIDRIRSNNERSNLMVVTKDAHAKIHHKGSKPAPWECWPKNPTKW